MLERLTGKVLNRLLSKYFYEPDELEEDDEEDWDGDNNNNNTTDTDNEQQQTKRNSFAKHKKSPQPPSSAKQKTTTTSSLLSGVWSGYLSLHDLRLRVAILNETCQARGIPLEFIHGSIRKMEMTIPWRSSIFSKKRRKTKTSNHHNPSNTDASDACVVVLDGVHIVARINDSMPTQNHIQQQMIQTRRTQIEKADWDLRNNNNNTTTASWTKRIVQRLQEYVQQGMLPMIADSTQVHVRDVHIRIEDVTTAAGNNNNSFTDPFAVGIILESMHIQHDSSERRTEPSQPTTTPDTDPSSSVLLPIYKLIEINRLGVYWNALEQQEHDPILPKHAWEQKILHALPAQQIIHALDETICRRRSVTTSSRNKNRVPQHVYILQPLDGQCHAVITTALPPPATNSIRRRQQQQAPPSSLPIVKAVFTIPDVTFQIRDYQCLQLVRLIHLVQEYKYSLRHWRFRPTGTVRDDPGAWWQYACTAIRHELIEKHRVRWSWVRFRNQFETRKRYCDLYQAQQQQQLTHQEEQTSYWSKEQQIELQNLEDGVIGDLSVQDIILYRILVNKRMDSTAPQPESGDLSNYTWLRRSISSFLGDDVEDSDYERLLEYWQNWSNSIPGREIAHQNDNQSLRTGTAVAVELHVDNGRLSLFSPLGSTSDQSQLRRFQERFLELTFSDFGLEVLLMNDFETTTVDLVLGDLEVGEIRFNHKKYPIITRAALNHTEQRSISPSRDGEEQIPLVIARISRNPPDSQDFSYGIQCRMRKLSIHLVVDCEWVGKIKHLIQPIPQLQKVAKFWRELDMAHINSWASKRLGILGKVETAVSNHKSLDVDIELDCPVFFVSMTETSTLVCDFGRAQIRTLQLAGIASSRLIRSLGLQTQLEKSKLMGFDKSFYTDKVDFSLNKGGFAYDRLPSDLSVDRPSFIGTPGPRQGHAPANSSLSGYQLDGSILFPLNGTSDKSEQTNADNADSLFYDTYELSLRSGGFRMESRVRTPEVLSSGFQARSTFQRSIIPADHTLSRYKFNCIVEDVLITLSRSQIELFGAAMLQWKAVILTESSLQQSVSVFPETRRRSLVEVLSPETFVDTSVDSDIDSQFDEAEFFDTMEDGSFMSDQENAILDDNWIAESESILDNETRSASPSPRRRFRRSSISEVSSLSEGSIKRRIHFPEEHLSAENLARLEEEGPDDTVDNEDASFHSAFSLSRMRALVQETEEDILDIQCRLDELKSRLTEIRRLDDKSTGSKDAIDNALTKKAIRLEGERLAVELKSLQAARYEILTRIQVAEEFKEEVNDGNDSTVAHALFAARGVSSLIKSAKKRDKNVSAFEHNAFQGLKRELFVLSIVFTSTHLQFRELRQENHGKQIDESFAVHVSKAAAILRQKKGEGKFYISTESMCIFLQERTCTDEFKHLILMGGVRDSFSDQLFSTRYPEFESSSAEERFLRLALDFRRSPSKQSEKIFKVGFCIGDIEFMLTNPHLRILSDTIPFILPKKGNNVSGNPNTMNGRLNTVGEAHVNFFLDFSSRLSSLRFVLGDSLECSTTLSLSDIGLRIVGSSCSQIYSDRSVVDLHCGNIQVIDVTRSSGACEIFGKQDIYSPILKLRSKLQLVPKHFNGGWVVDQTASSENNFTRAKLGRHHDTLLSDIDTAWNIHVGGKIGIVRILITPSALLRCLCNVTLLSKFQRGDHPLVSGMQQTKKRNVVDLLSMPVRWRADISLKELLICLESAENTVVETSQERIEVSLSASISAQLSSQIDGAINVTGSFNNVSITRTVDQWLIVEPLSIGFYMQSSFSKDFFVFMENPQFRLSDNFPWLEGCRPGINIEIRGDMTDSDVFSFTVSSLNFNLVPSICANVMRLLKELRMKLRLYGGNQKSSSVSTKSWKSSEESLASSKKALTFSSSGAVVRAFLDSTDARINPSKFLAALVCGKIEGLINKVHGALSCSLSIENASLIDQTNNPGIHGLNIVNHGALYRENVLSPAFMLTAEFNGDSNGRAKVDLSIIGLRCLLLPSLVQSMLLFKKGTDTCFRNNSSGDFSLLKTPSTEKKSPLSRVKLIEMSVNVASLEFVLSTKNVPKYIKNDAIEPINVVVFRLSLRLLGTMRILSLDDSMTEVSRIGVTSSELHEIEKSIKQKLKSRFLDTHPEIHCTTFEIFIDDFQVLRTAVMRSDCQPVKFMVSPPAAGEQRITNSFDFVVNHQAVFAFFRFARGADDECVAFLSHSIHLRSGFVDVLVYISQSSGGMNEAMRVTVLPVLKLLQNNNSSFSVHNETSFRTGCLKDALRESTTIFSASVDGFKVTLVPGGATRLTESPIIKFELFCLAAGGALVPVMTDSNYLANSQLSSSATRRHMLTGCWLSCEVSASYHNRRLVAWEPFIEPWTLVLRIGADLVRVFNLRPIGNSNDGIVASSHKPFESPMKHTAGAGSNRLRDLGRLLRSPFSANALNEDDESECSIGLEIDFCYLLLSLLKQSYIVPALLSHVNSLEKMSFTLLPGSLPIQWLQLFGYPDLKNIDQQRTPTVALVCWVSDTITLNINLTGALLENMSEYVSATKGNRSRQVPHWIRNDSGLTIRFHEVLDHNRVQRQEKVRKVILSNNSEAPLSLKRSISQSCDPHQAFIILELGNYEETVERVDETNLDTSRGSRSSSFAYRVTTKIPVDTVGMHRYALDWNVGRRNDHEASNQRSHRSSGWVIVRVALHEGIKMVSIESPIVLRNMSDVDMLCEIRDHGGLSLLWRSLVRSESKKGKEVSVSLPADIVPSIHGTSYSFSAVAFSKTGAIEHESDLPSIAINFRTQLSPPPPYSPSSFGKGVIKESYLAVSLLDPESKVDELCGTRQSVHLNLCALRIGSFSQLQEENGKSQPEIPEQRMLVFRSTFAIENHLATPVLVQIRVKKDAQRVRETAENEVPPTKIGWKDLGLVGCASDCRWSGAIPTEIIEIRIRIVEIDGSLSRQFPHWSDPLAISPSNFTTNHLVNANKSDLFMRVYDASDVALQISLGLWNGNVQSKRASSIDSVKDFSTELPFASRMICLYCPFWIVDSTGLDLQYRARSLIAGQVNASFHPNGGNFGTETNAYTHGLAELLDSSELSYLPSQVPFRVLMIGDAEAAHLNIRRRMTRETGVRESVSPWSDPIPLTLERTSYYNISVPPPPRLMSPGEKILGSTDVQEAFSLHTRIVLAPRVLGGIHGTKLVHVVCRYTVINELGREIEICGSTGNRLPISVVADGHARPFHFDDLGTLQFRPKEFGWLWSGRFSIRKNRQEVILRLKHKLKESSLIVSIEFHTQKLNGTCLIVFRLATHAPYRIENHTMLPLQYRQIPTMTQRAFATTYDSLKNTVILPFHNAEFAWDEPDYGKRSVSINIADFGDLVKNYGCRLLGTFKIDNIAPGVVLDLLLPNLIGTIVADGPTRVLQVMEQSTPKMPSQEHDATRGLQKVTNNGADFSVVVSAQFTHGLGLSIVDWQPQELMYIRFNDISLKRNYDACQETVDFSVGNIIIDNQLWVTPYPVLLRMGSTSHKKRNKRSKALVLSWCRTFPSKSSYGDFTFLKSITLTTQPSIVSVDGTLAGAMIEMARRVKDIGKKVRTDRVLHRDQHLRLTLGISNTVDGNKTYETGTTKHSIINDLSAAMDNIASTAMAAKFNSLTRHPDQIDNSRWMETSTEEQMPAFPSKPRHKVYIERLRISMAAAEVSWSGFLPVSSTFPRFMRPALTFEGLPLLVRSYAVSHTFGSFQDHLQNLKAHFLSFWRILDLIVGVSAKPTFLIRATVFTCMESISATSQNVATTLRSAQKLLDNYSYQLAQHEESQAMYGLYRMTMYSTCNVCSSIFGGFSTISSACSSLLRYDAKRHSARSKLIRSRNPRLFANIGGNELLVEYVEGENAGKALLSRVRMGAHLGEGYLYHVEEVHLFDERRKKEIDMDPSAMILMLTWDRVLLLKGVLDKSFCEVDWEASFVDLVYMDFGTSMKNSYCRLNMWFLTESEGKIEEHYSKSLLAESRGLANLHCKCIFVPNFSIDQLLLKMKCVSRFCIENRNVNS